MLSSSPVSPGEVIAGKYRVERVLGQGGMGVVVAALHLELDQRVAIKFLHAHAPAAALERFLREAKAAALVKSEHVCRVFDVGRLASGEPYIVMEYLDGTDLAEKLEAEGPQPIKEVVGWIIEACDALSSAHRQGIIHRDLKPANLFLQQTGADRALKIVDFGISKLPTSGALTSTAIMMGSPFYMSPEQLESSRDVDLRSDVWSLGVVLYELLTNETPFNGESLVQIAVQTRERAPIAPTEHRRDLPMALERIILRCLAKRPADRFQNVDEMVVELAPFAPPEVASLVQKLSKRARAPGARSSDPQIVLARTMDGSSVAAGPASDPSLSVLAASTAETMRPKKADDDGDNEEVAVPPAPPAISVGTFEPVQSIITSGKRTRQAMFGTGLAVFALLTGIALVKLARDKPVATTAPSGIVEDATSAPPVATVPMATSAAASSSPSPPEPASAIPIASPHPATRPLPRSAPSAPPSAPPSTSPPAASGRRHQLDRDYVP